MAFQNDNFNLGSTIFDSVMNLTFLVDITIQFCSAFYDLDFNVIDDRKVNKALSYRLYTDNCDGVYFWVVLHRSDLRDPLRCNFRHIGQLQ